MVNAKIMLFTDFTYSMLITNQYGRTYKPKKGHGTKTECDSGY